MLSFAKWLILFGIALVIVGSLLYLCNKLGISLGKLPGDIYIKTEKFGFYFPVATSIIASIFLTILLNLIFWLVTMRR